MHFDTDFRLTDYRTATNWGHEKKALIFSYLMECATKDKGMRELIEDEEFARKAFHKVDSYEEWLRMYRPTEFYLSSGYEQIVYVMNRHRVIFKLARMVLGTQANLSSYYAHQLLRHNYYKLAMEHADSIGRRLEFELAVNHYLFKGK